MAANGFRTRVLLFLAVGLRASADFLVKHAGEKQTTVPIQLPDTIQKHLSTPNPPDVWWQRIAAANQVQWFACNLEGPPSPTSGSPFTQPLKASNRSESPEKQPHATTQSTRSDVLERSSLQAEMHQSENGGTPLPRNIGGQPVIPNDQTSADAPVHPGPTLREQESGTVAYSQPKPLRPAAEPELIARETGQTMPPIGLSQRNKKHHDRRPDFLSDAPVLPPDESAFQHDTPWENSVSLSTNTQTTEEKDKNESRQPSSQPILTTDDHKGSVPPTITRTQEAPSPNDNHCSLKAHQPLPDALPMPWRTSSNGQRYFDPTQKLWVLPPETKKREEIKTVAQHPIVNQPVPNPEATRRDTHSKTAANRQIHRDRHSRDRSTSLTQAAIITEQTFIAQPLEAEQLPEQHPALSTTRGQGAYTIQEHSTNLKAPITQPFMATVRQEQPPTPESYSRTQAGSTAEENSRLAPINAIDKAQKRNKFFNMETPPRDLSQTVSGAPERALPFTRVSSAQEPQYYKATGAFPLTHITSPNATPSPSVPPPCSSETSSETRGQEHSPRLAEMLAHPFTPQGERPLASSDHHPWQGLQFHSYELETDRPFQQNARRTDPEGGVETSSGVWPDLPPPLLTNVFQEEDGPVFENETERSHRLCQEQRGSLWRVRTF